MMLQGRTFSALALLALAASSATALAVGCSGGAPNGYLDPNGGDAASDATQSATDGASEAAEGDGGGGGSSDAPSGPPQAVTFVYTPAWSGATKVEVIGGFGQASDWTAPLVTLTANGSGGFTGATQLPPGQYLYVLKITGDADAPAGFARYALDPRQSTVAPCPSQSPTFDKNAPNPCSTLNVPIGGAAEMLTHVKGTVRSDGAPAAGWLVVLEREEPQSHHFFVNRSTTGSDGMFDLIAAPGNYRLQVQHPTYLKEDDAARNPNTLAALRRTISSAFPNTTDVVVTVPDVAFHAYSAFEPQDGGATLPTTFTFGVSDAGAPRARLTVYSGPKEIGDPWFASPLAAATTVTFDGGFNTKQAVDPAVKPGTVYFWGAEQEDVAQSDGGVGWTGQTMVFPITWH